jgi:ATP-dependent RNA helicase DDX27
MSPTRELAQQLYNVFQTIAKYCYITSALIIGGCSNEEQEAMLKPVPDVLFATPGRIVDQLFNSKTITVDHILIYVLDEADRLLGRGFEAELTAMNSKLPGSHQTLMFTATFSDSVQKLAAKVQKRDAVKVSIDIFCELSENLTQQFVKVKTEDKRLLALVALCQNQCRQKTLVFLPTKLLAHQIALLFNYIGLKAAELHADLPQPERRASVERFTGNEVRILLASDLAARGLDIPDVEFVINYTGPTEIERYIHRVGRTARAGRKGTAVLLVREAHEKQIKRRMSKNAKGPVEKVIIPPELMEKARDVIGSFQAKVDEDLKKEEEERVKRVQENELRKMKALLDVEEEIPAKEKDEKPKSRKR